jgi:hypothetical protein
MLLNCFLIIHQFYRMKESPGEKDYIDGGAIEPEHDPDKNEEAKKAGGKKH